MEVTKIPLSEHMAFMKELYKNDLKYKDNKTGGIKIVCESTRPFYKNSKQEIIAVKDSGKILCSAVLIIHKNAPEMLSVGFFESVQMAHGAVELLLKHAETFGKENDANIIVVALDGHVNYGIGFSEQTTIPLFGESYNKEYYHDYFRNLKRIKLVSFYESKEAVKKQLSRDRRSRNLNNLDITLEYGNFGNGFDKTMKIYTDLNNDIFTEHRYCFKREYSEDYDLFNDIRPLLRKENLIFAKKNGEYVGFVLWYPDYNELVSIGKGAGIGTFIKHKLLKQEPRTAKLVEIGVVKAHRNSPMIFKLFDEAMKAASPKNDRIVSSWILDENSKSKAIATRYTKNHCKNYYAYEKEI